MINILFLIDHIWNSNGGTEGQLLMLINNLDRSRYSPHLFCLKETPWTKSAKLDFPMHVLHINKLMTPSIVPKLMHFRKYCKENNIDIIQTYFNDSLIFGVIAGRFSGVAKIIASRRNLGPGFWKRNDLLRAFKVLKPLVTRYMANSEATRQSIVTHEGIDPGKIDVIYNGLDLCRFGVIDNRMRGRKRAELGLDDSKVLIGMVAHLRKEKNISMFVDAAARLSKKYPQARYIVLGEGRERENIENRIKERKVQDIFFLVGGVMDIMPYLAAMDVACLTSDGESFSNSIIEYQAAGLPVIATGVGGNLEAIPSREMLFQPGDIDRFILLLSRMIENADIRAEVGRAGKDITHNRYSVEKMVEGHEDMYGRCLGFYSS